MSELVKLRRALRDHSPRCGFVVFCEALRELLDMAKAQGYTLDDVNKADEESAK